MLSELGSSSSAPSSEVSQLSTWSSRLSSSQDEKVQRFAEQIGALKSALVNQPKNIAVGKESVGEISLLNKSNENSGKNL